MSDLQEQVKAAATPMEALLLLARALDALHVQVEELGTSTPDPWAGWGEATTGASSDVEQRTQERVVNEKGHVEVVLPPVDDGKKERRRKFAREHLDLHNAFDESYIEYYAEGGPQWLYNYDRDYVLSVPREVRVAMIEDVQEFSVSEAQEMGRDLLKDKGTGVDYQAAGAAIDNIRQSL